MAKTIVFYGSDHRAAKEKHEAKKEVETHQFIQADAYQGERLEGDKIEFMDDVPAGERTRIESIWGKFDNRISHDPALVGGPSAPTGFDPAANRGNLTDKYRSDDPKKVEPDQLKHPGVAAKMEAKPEPGSLQSKPVGLDGVTGKPVVRNPNP